MIGKGKFQGQKTIMKQKLCFRITTKLGEFEGTTLFMARKAPTIQKTREKRKEREELFLAFTYELQLRGLNVDAHF